MRAQSSIIVNESYITGLDKQNISAYILIISLAILGAQKNRLIETVLLSIHNVCFGWEIRKLFLSCIWML